MSEKSTNAVITVNELNKDRVKELVVELALEGAIDFRTAEVICSETESL